MIGAGKFSYNLFEEGKSRTHERHEIDHKKIRQFLRDEEKKTFLIYEMHNALLQFYDNFNIICIDSRGNPVKEKDKATGAIIANFIIQILI